MARRSAAEPAGDRASRPERDFGPRGIAGLVVLAALTVLLPRYDPADAGARDALDVAGLVTGAAFWLLLLWLAFGHHLAGRRRRS